MHACALEAKADQWVNAQYNQDAVWLDKAIAQGVKRTFVCRSGRLTATERVWRRSFIIVSNYPTHPRRYLLQAYQHQYVLEQDNALVKGPPAF